MAFPFAFVGFARKLNPQAARWLLTDHDPQGIVQVCGCSHVTESNTAANIEVVCIAVQSVDSSVEGGDGRKPAVGDWMERWACACDGVKGPVTRRGWKVVSVQVYIA